MAERPVRMHGLEVGLTIHANGFLLAIIAWVRGVSERHILAMGGGGFSMEPDNPRLDDFALGLTGKEVPRVCFLATASGDAEGTLEAFYAAFPPERATAMHLPLFGPQRGDLRERLLANDLVYIGGGSTANLLAIWRLHGMDAILREAWAQGIVLTGISAGACCLFQGCLTDAFGPSLAPLADGLGLLEGSFCPHHDTEAGRPARYRQVIGEGLPPGIALDDGVALHFVGTRLEEVVTSRPEAGAYRVHRGSGSPNALPVRYLGAL